MSSPRWPAHRRAGALAANPSATDGPQTLYWEGDSAEPWGGATFGDNNQVADLEIYGSCGTIFPDSYEGYPSNLRGTGGLLVAYGG